MIAFLVEGKKLDRVISSMQGILAWVLDCYGTRSTEYVATLESVMAGDSLGTSLARQLTALQLSYVRFLGTILRSSDAKSTVDYVFRDSIDILAIGTVDDIYSKSGLVYWDRKYGNYLDMIESDIAVESTFTVTLATLHVLDYVYKLD